ncbi:MAG: ATP synthase F0 subunit B [Candidatus Caenarcaniphilales bacterium]|jgi:F-type H+-transporting ATPase subunit b|nr:ATP synthase F0 subunit B [Candidatus Caenarcaniphilales bacterium]
MFNQETIKLILESNLLNFAIAIGLIVYLVGKMLPAASDKRKLELEDGLKKASEAKIRAEEELEKLNKEIERSKAEAQLMVSNAKSSAEALYKDIVESAHKEISRLEANAQREIENSRHQAISNLKKQIVGQVMIEVEKQLKLNQTELSNKITEKINSDLEALAKN